MTLFKEMVDGWDSWAQIYQSIPAFEPLIKAILALHHFNFTKVEQLQAGTNAVFRVNDKIVKIFAPIESGCSTNRDFEMEIYGLQYSQDKIPVPHILAQGSINDKYIFNYIILSVVEGDAFSNVMDQYSVQDKKKIGEQLRFLTDKLNRPNYNMPPLDLIKRERNNERWLQYPKPFQEERQQYLNDYKIKDALYVHGDLNGGNILIDKNKRIFIIDFADALEAPIEYEWALIITELFHFDKDYLIGFFKDLSIKQYIDICISGLLIHDFGADIICDQIANPKEIESIDTLKKLIEVKLVESFRE